MKRVSTVALLLLTLVSWLFPAGIMALPAESEVVRIGVVSFRPKLLTEEQWQPLIKALKRAVPERDFVVEVFGLSELEAAVASRQADFVLTNPGHYIRISHLSGLSAPLATVISDESGQPLSVFGGVILTKADRSDIRDLVDLRGKKIAAVDLNSLGGYLMQAFELAQVGVRLPKDGELVITQLPHDNVVNSVLAGQADAGFVRCGVLEAMAREGKLDLARLKVLNPQNLPHFPQALSTRLYPEWPFAALPHVDEQLARQVTAALFTLEQRNLGGASAMGIQGFTIPADYAPIADLMRELRVPPFDAPRFTARDVWDQYHWAIVAALLAGILIVSLALRLLATNRRLGVEHQLLLQQSFRLEESEARFRSLVQTMPDLVWLKDPSGRYLMCNPAFESLYGAPQAQIIGKRDEDFVSAETAAAFQVNDQKAVAARGPVVDEEWLTFASDGRRALMETTKVPLHIGSEFIGILGIAHDITERDRVESALRERTESLLRSNADLEQFAYSVSHDMRQPLRSVTGHLQLLERSVAGKLDEDSRENLTYALEGARRMDAMIVSLLDYSRVGRKTEAKKWLDCRQPLDEAMGFLAPSIEQEQARVDVTGEWPRLFASRDELTRLFQNLIGNALKYHEPGQPPAVEVHSAADAKCWRVSVRDDGIGIDPAQADRLFQFFSRLQSRTRFEGTGMGLALCRRIVEHHGGRIWVESAGLGRGSVFFFELPINRDDAVESSP